MPPRRPAAISAESRACTTSFAAIACSGRRTEGDHQAAAVEARQALAHALLLGEERRVGLAEAREIVHPDEAGQRNRREEERAERQEQRAKAGATCRPITLAPSRSARR